MARRKTAFIGIFLPAASLLSVGSARAQTATPVSIETPSPGEAEADLRAAERAAVERDNDRVLIDSLDLIEREHVDTGVTREELIEAALRGMVDHLNRRGLRAGYPPANAVLTRNEVSRLTQSISGSVTGIGVLANATPDGIDVLRVFADSPAGRAGLKAGDRIASVNDVSLANGNLDAIQLLRGEDGSPVRLAVIRSPGSTDESTLEIKVVRARYQVSSVSSRIVEGNAGYLRIASFTRGAAEDVAGVLLGFREQGVWGVVIDLRGNPGGSLEEATRIAGMFIEPGTPLVQIQAREGPPQTLDASGEVLWDPPAPIAVLVDAGTASAAEVLASSLQTSERALLVGERTAGRGLGESVFQLPTGGALRLATARYGNAFGESWIRTGLTPDSLTTATTLDPTEDPQLRTALVIMSRFYTRGPETSPYP